ncbi:uncharacterized protein LOC115237991 isoform X1 [Formica exsecta]|uniref:uncharacterized protein LOC115237991 isoform X1 n=1 Tax=Formica exsecta TaxID=72781 RepID=UPI0011445006|nr:uncharacterized protein LOC115237991 isoform X1 [Formica exsecta]
MTMRLHVFILLFFVGSVFGRVNSPISRSNANIVSTSLRVLNGLYNLQPLGKELGHSRNMTSPDTSDMNDNIPELPKPGLLVYIIFVEILKTICIDEDNMQRILNDTDLLPYKYWIKHLMCNISKTLFFADSPIFG